jgi:hypothetical protein
MPQTIQVCHEEFKLTGTHQLQVLDDGIYLLGVNVMGKKIIEALLLVSKGVSPEGNCEKPKYTCSYIVSRMKDKITTYI